MAAQIVSLPNETGTRRAHEHIPVRGDDWVLEGCRLVADFAAGTLKVTNGELLIADSGTLYWVKTPTTSGLSIPGGTSSVYYVVDTSGPRPTGSVQVGGSPSQPSLELGTVDASGETTSLSNTDPTYSVTNSERLHTTDAETGPLSVITDSASRSAIYGFVNPQAEYVEGENTTFVVYRGDDADPFATAYDHDSRSWSPHVRIATNPLPNTDEHGIPGLCIDDNGTLHVFFGSHSTEIQYASSDSAYDVSSWTSTGLSSVPDGTYNSPLADGNDLYVLYRADGGHGSPYPSHSYATIIRSTDGGSSWTDIGPVIDTTGHPDTDSDAYVGDFDVGPSGLHLSWIIATGSSHDDTRKNMYHAVYDPVGGHMATVSGSSLGSTITWSQHSQVEVYNGDFTDIPRHAFAPDGTVYVSFNAYNSSDDVIEWKRAWYDGGWTVEQIGGAITNHWANYGDIRFDDNGTFEAHLITGDGSYANTGSGSGASGGSYQRYRESGGSWDVDTLIAADDGFASARVSCVRDGSDAFAALSTEQLDTPDLWNASLYATGATRSQMRSGSVSYASNPDRTLQQALTTTNPGGSRDLLSYNGGSGNNLVGHLITSTDYLLVKNDWGGLGMVGDGSAKMLVNPDGTTENENAGFVPFTGDLSGVTGNRHGEISHHNGGDTNPADLYWWDANGDVSSGSWIRVGDNATTITP